MIDRIVIENFKSLRRVDLRLGRMNLFIGANASGKSNFLDALRVLQGVGNGFTIGEILDGKPEGATNAKWDAIRGGSRYASFAGTEAGGGTDDIKFHIYGRFTGGPAAEWIGVERRKTDGQPALHWELLVEFSPTLGYVTHECFTVDGMVYDTEDASSRSPKDQRPAMTCPLRAAEKWSVPWNRERPLLGQLASGPSQRGLGSADDLPTMEESAAARAVCADHARGVAALLANIRRIEPELRFLRGYAQVAKVRKLGDRGENFAAIVQTICDEKKDKDVYLSWLRELRPEQIDDVGVLHGAVGEPLFMLRENGRELPATVLSDGTLRFAALAGAFFQPDMPSLMTMEEIENGIHANRLRILLDLLRTQADDTGTQIVATTHSAAMLDWLDEKDYETTFLCTRDEATGESHIHPLATVPHFLDIVRKTPTSELFAEGWLETVS